MYRKILISGVTAAAVLGAGGTAMALTGSDSTTGTPAGSSSGSTSSQSTTHKHAKGVLRRMAHAQIVAKGKDGFVTHDLINGTVTSVSSSSITVQAADKTSETFAINSDTKVRMRTSGKGAASTISAVKDGDHVIVAGTGTSSYTAKHIVDVKK